MNNKSTLPQVQIVTDFFSDIDNTALDNYLSMKPGMSIYNRMSY